MALGSVNPSGVSTAFIYPTQTGQGQGIDSIIDATPGFTNPPIIFEPYPMMAGNALNLNIIATGGLNWGGCEVWGSVDNTTYGRIGVIFAGDVQGVLTSALPIGTDPDTTNSIQVDVTMSRGQIISASTQLADDSLSLCYVDGEIIGYSTVTLVSTYHYTLGTYLRRGVYGTTSLAHNSGTQFAIISAEVFRQTYPLNLVGKTVYFKFPSFNQLGLQLQDLSVCVVYTYVFAGHGVVSGTTGGAAPCPIIGALMGGTALVDLGTLSDCISATCDLGIIDTTTPYCIDLGVIGT